MLVQRAPGTFSLIVQTIECVILLLAARATAHH
jgi:hypothetical protein